MGAIVNVMMNVPDSESLRARRDVRRTVSQLLAAAAFTASVGAVLNLIYERFFDEEAYAAGPVLARAAFAFAFPFPFILAGLLLVGLPTDYVLHRLRLANGIVFAVIGAGAGGLIGIATASGLPRLQMTFAIYGGVSALAWWVIARRT